MIMKVNYVTHLYDVIVAPYFITRPSHTYGRVNGDVELRCDIGGYPQPRIYWLKVGRLPATLFSLLP